MTDLMIVLLKAVFWCYSIVTDLEVLLTATDWP